MSVYEPTPWVNDNPPPLNEDNLNHAERGTTNASTELRDIGLGSTVVAEADVCGTADFVAHASETVVGGVKMYTVTDTITGEITGFIDSGTIADEPTAVIDFNASDRLPGMVRLSFTQHLDTMWYDLYVGDSLVAPDVGDGFEYLTAEGTWDFHLVANNTFGTSNSNIDSGTAKAIPTDVPADITDFTATDDEAQAITFNWTDNGDAFRFAIYAGVTLVQTDVEPGDTVAIPEGTVTYHVRAINHLGTTDSNTDDGTSVGMTPSAITDFAATDAIVGDTAGQIIMTFTNVPQPATYDLYKDGLLIRTNIHSGYALTTSGGMWLFKVQAVNPAGATDSNEDSGTAISALYPPEKPDNFTASDDGRRNITIDFDEALDAEQYDLYKDGVLETTDIYPGYQFATVAGTWNFFVRATNLIGHNDSDADSGTALEAFTVIPDPVNDLIVSTDLEATVLITFTELDNTTRFDLYRDGEPYKSDVYTGMLLPSFPGEWQFSILSTNPIGYVMGAPVTGSATPSSDIPTFPTDDFTASNGDYNKIVMSWTPAVGASRYDLYKNGTKIREDVTSPYNLQSPVGTWDFNIKAVNLIGTATSRIDEGSAVLSPQPPSEILDFEASENLTESIQITYTVADYAVSYDLYKDDIPFVFNVTSGDIVPCEIGTFSFYVVAINTLGEVPSNPDSGTSVAKLAPPTYISDFNATNGELNQITFTFTPATGATNHALYQSSARIEENIADGFVLDITSTTTLDYYLKAENKDEFTDSNPDTGAPLSVLPGSVQIDYDGFTILGGDVPDGTVVINDGVGTFLPPTGCDTVTVCMCAGGGSGAMSSELDTTVGGGNSGDIFSNLLPSTASLPLVIGIGGVFVQAGSSVVGTNGTNSSIGSTSVSGGLGGTYNSSGGAVQYPGDGASFTTPCGDVYTDGTKVIIFSSVYGGEAGLFGDGGEPLPDGAVTGTGAGGGGGTNDANGKPGAGGDGRIILSWG